jgi:hypothetical protein
MISALLNYDSNYAADIDKWQNSQVQQTGRRSDSLE